MRPQRREKGVSKAKRVLKIWSACTYHGKDLEDFENKTRHMTMVSTRKSCSCYMCGNPRKFWNEKTMQEKKSDISFREQLDDAA
jgi:hypothetical protein